jgi:hypothetical protein
MNTFQAKLATIALLLLAACGQKHSVSDLTGRTYYLSQAGYSCQGQTSATPVSSYKDSVRFTGNNVCHTGDACNDFITCAAASDADIKIDQENLDWVEYKGVRYQYSATPPLSQ